MDMHAMVVDDSGIMRKMVMKSLLEAAAKKPARKHTKPRYCH
jgi:hypothetical protein